MLTLVGSDTARAVFSRSSSVTTHRLLSKLQATGVGEYSVSYTDLSMLCAFLPIFCLCRARRHCGFGFRGDCPGGGHRGPVLVPVLWGGGDG